MPLAADAVREKRNKLRLESTESEDHFSKTSTKAPPDIEKCRYLANLYLIR